MKKNIKKEKQIKIPKKVENFLAKAGIKHELTGHRTVYTAFDKAATLRVKPDIIAKVLTIKIGRDLAMAVIGGNKNLNIEKLQKLARPKGEARHQAAKTEKIGFAKEKAIAETFKGVDPGAIPPFEGLWKMKVFCDRKLLESPKIILSAGKYDASLIITPTVFKKINSEMAIGNFSAPRKNPKQAGKKPKNVKKTIKSAKPKAKKKTVKPALKKKKK